MGGVDHRQPRDGDDHGVARAQHQTGGLLGAGGVRAQVRGPIGMEKKYWCFSFFCEEQIQSEGHLIN